MEFTSTQSNFKNSLNNNEPVPSGIWKEPTVQGLHYGWGCVLEGTEGSGGDTF